VLRKVIARLFSRLTRDSFPVLDPLRQPCPATPRFRPALEMLELRMMPTVTATYTAASGLFVVNASSSTTATAMTVTASTSNQVVLTLTGDSFTKAGDASGGSSSDFVLSNGNATLTVYTGTAPLTNFDITQLANSESLSFSLVATTSGVSNISITGTGDAVTFTGINNNVSGNLTDTSGSITVSSGGSITVGGAVSAGGAVTVTGTCMGTQNKNLGVDLGNSTTAGSSVRRSRCRHGPQPRLILRIGKPFSPKVAVAGA
jgi:hypothetical protein